MPPSPTIHKFGGAAVADPTGIRRAAEILAGVSGPRVAVVSAMAGVTDALLGLARAAVARADDTPRRLAQVQALHRATAEALAPEDAVLRETVEASLRELAEMVQGLGLLRELSPRLEDQIVARGERLAAHFLVVALHHRGRAAEYVDASRILLTRGPHRQAAPDLPGTRRAAVTAGGVLNDLLKAAGG